MLNNLFQGIFAAEGASVIAVGQFLLCVAVAMAIGLFLAGVFAAQRLSSTGFLVTLAMLPAIVCVVIMMVNGNVGAGVAVAGVFSLVRFRSIPGTASEIGMIFLAMGTGLICGMGYLAYAVLFAAVLGGAELLLSAVGARLANQPCPHKTLRITVPEDLNYTAIFDDLFQTYTTRCEMLSVKTTNMGSLLKLSYHVTLRDPRREKEFIDDLRCRNGNLEISMAKQEANNYEL